MMLMEGMSVSTNIRARHGKFNTYLTMIDGSLKSYFRNPAAVFFALFFPVVFMLIFGYLNFGGEEGRGSYRAFLVPGIVAMMVMQTCVFGVVFTLIRFKVQKVLRRLQATPAGPIPILIAQVVVTLIVVLLSAGVLFGISAALFADIRNLYADTSALSWVYIVLLLLAGSVTFISIGLAISGRLRSEQAAAPLANIITLPMLFFSGVFFSTDVLPSWLATISEYLPLTFLIDGVRGQFLESVSFESFGFDLLGLAVWAAATFVLAIFLFKWE